MSSEKTGITNLLVLKTWKQDIYVPDMLIIYIILFASGCFFLFCDWLVFLNPVTLMTILIVEVQTMFVHVNVSFWISHVLLFVVKDFPIVFDIYPYLFRLF